MPPFAPLVAQLGVVLLVAIVLGGLAQRLGLPAVAGELLGGVLLGPSVLGTVAPGALFVPDPAVAEARGVVLQVGLLLFLLVVGLEVDPAPIARQLRALLPTAGLGLAVPFVLGYAAVSVAPGLWGVGGEVDRLALTIGVALAISALPVIARIMSDLGLLQTDVGRLVLAAAVVDDLIGWAAFAALLGAGTAGWTPVLVVVAGFAGAILAARIVGAKAGPWLRARPGGALGLVLAVALVAAGIAERAGVHAFFGAMLVGLAASRLDRAAFEPLQRLVRSFFAPLYFGAVGLSVNVGASFDLGLVALVFAIACIGKLVGAGFGARLGGVPPRPALAVAAGLNARGAVGVLMASTARQAGLVDDRLLVALVVTALGTSVLAGPLMRRALALKP